MIVIKEDKDHILGIDECVLNKSTFLLELSNCYALLESIMNLTTTSKALNNSLKVVVPSLATSRTKAKSKRCTRL